MGARRTSLDRHWPSSCLMPLIRSSQLRSNQHRAETNTVTTPSTVWTHLWAASRSTTSRNSKRTRPPWTQAYQRPAPPHRSKSRATLLTQRCSREDWSTKIETLKESTSRSMIAHPYESLLQTSSHHRLRPWKKARVKGRVVSPARSNCACKGKDHSTISCL